jgi:hypothetical protein
MLLTGMRGLFGGKAALAAGFSGDEEQEAAGGDSGGGQNPSDMLNERVAAAVASAMSKVMGANAAGFKQAARFGDSGGSSGAGPATGGGKGATGAGKGGGADKPPGGAPRQGGGRSKCGKCGRWHAGECFPIHEACGRRHNPDLECYGRDPGDKLRRRPFGRDRRGEQAVAAAVMSDAELAAAAQEGVNVWEQGGHSINVAAWQAPSEEEEDCLDDDLTAAVAAGGLRQVPPASFHQKGMVTRGAAAKLLQEQQQEETQLTPEAAAEPEAVEGTSSGSQETLPLEREDPFKELRQIIPSSNFAVVALDPKADGELLKVLLRSGADTALTVIRMPSMSLRQLLQRSELSLLPAATVMTSPAVLAAAASDKPAGPSVVTGSSGSSGAGLESALRRAGAPPGGRFLPTLPYLDNSAFKLYDERGKQALPKLRLLLDSGADGAILALHVAERAGVEWAPSSNAGVAIANGGTARPQGLLQGVKLLVLPGTPNPTALAFKALVMDTGGRGVYDAILGREQMHLLGMVMDFGLQKCFTRPKLSQGVMDLVEVPWTCLKPVKQPKAASVAGLVSTGSWEGEQEAHLMASGDVERNPGSTGTRLGGEELELDAVMVQLEAEGGVKPTSGSGRGRIPGLVAWNPQLKRYQLNTRVLNDYCCSSADKPWKNGWSGEEEARLMAAGDVEPNPGPRRYNFSAYPGQAELFITIMCAFVAALAGAVGVGYAMMGWFTNAAFVVAVGWCAAMMSCPRLMYWAGLKLEMARATRARRPKKRPSWQLLAALCGLPTRCVRQHKFKLRAVWLWLVLWVLLVCGTASATAGALEQGVHGSLGVGTNGVTGAHFTSPDNFCPRGTELLAGELAGAGFLSHEVSSTRPAQLLEALEPAGEREPPEFAPDTTIDPEGKWQFAHHPDATPEEQAQLQEAVKSRRQAFAYSHAEMPGYEHKVGWKLKHEDPIKEPCHSRRLSPAERGILDEKCTELEGAGLIKELPSTNKYACHPVLAAKKDGVSKSWVLVSAVSDTYKCWIPAV